MSARCLHDNADQCSATLSALLPRIILDLLGVTACLSKSMGEMKAEKLFKANGDDGERQEAEDATRAHLAGLCQANAPLKTPEHLPHVDPR